MEAARIETLVDFAVRSRTSVWSPNESLWAGLAASAAKAPAVAPGDDGQREAVSGRSRCPLPVRRYPGEDDGRNHHDRDIKHQRAKPDIERIADTAEIDGRLILAA
jgi:hypothetical protein